MDNSDTNSQNSAQQNPVGWFEIYVDDIDRAKKFYENVFKYQMRSMDDPTNSEIRMVGFPMNPGGQNAGGALVHMNGMKSGGNSTIVYFVREDCSIEEARVQGAGGSVFKEKMSIGEYGFMSLCSDTEGNMFGIHSMK